MGYKALLTVDLENGVSAEKRKKFYDYLAQEKWLKIPELTTTWECSFTEHVDRLGAIAVIKDDVASAAKHAGVSHYQAAVQVGKGSITKF